MPVPAEFSDTRGWIRAFGVMRRLDPAEAVPGHRPPGPLARVVADTLDCPVHLRGAVRAFMEAGGAIEDVRQVDESASGRLAGCEMLRGRNVRRMYRFLEWE